MIALIASDSVARITIRNLDEGGLELELPPRGPMT